MATYKTQFGEKPPIGSNAGTGEAPNKNGDFTFPKTDDVGTNIEIARLHPKLRKAAATFVKNAKAHSNVYVIKIVTGVRPITKHKELRKKDTLKHDYKDSHHLTGTAFRIEVVSFKHVLGSGVGATCSIHGGNLTVDFDPNNHTNNDRGSGYAVGDTMQSSHKPDNTNSAWIVIVSTIDGSGGILTAIVIHNPNCTSHGGHSGNHPNINMENISTSLNKTKYLHETDGSITTTNDAHWKEIGQLAETQGFHWGGNGGNDLFQKYSNSKYGTGWNKNYFEFRDCGQRKGAKKYWTRTKDVDGWFEIGCPPE